MACPLNVSSSNPFLCGNTGGLKSVEYPSALAAWDSCIWIIFVAEVSANNKSCLFKLFIQGSFSLRDVGLTNAQSIEAIVCLGCSGPGFVASPTLTPLYHLKVLSVSIFNIQCVEVYVKGGVGWINPYELFHPTRSLGFWGAHLVKPNTSHLHGVETKLQRKFTSIL